jgi:hypothetical protein
MTSEEISRFREDRKKLSESHKILFSETSAILFRHDPIGINFEDNTDEYDPEAGTILSRLRSDICAEEVTDIVHEEFVRWFERETAGPRNKYTAIAEDILAAYQRWEKLAG